MEPEACSRTAARQFPNEGGCTFQTQPVRWNSKTNLSQCHIVGSTRNAKRPTFAIQALNLHMHQMLTVGAAANTSPAARPHYRDDIGTIRGIRP